MPVTLFSINYRTLNRLITSLFFVAITFSACKNKGNDVTVPAPQSISQLITSNPKLTLLTAALNRAGLTGSLSGAGPFTLFAPSDDAFRAAGFADVAAINAAPAATLTSILQYHLLSGSVPASAIPAGQTARPTSLTLAAPVYVNRASASGGGVSVNEARVVQADVPATNGIVHVIDRVLMPPAGSLLAIARADTSLSLLVALINRGGPDVLMTLSGTTPLTVFAPTNTALRADGISDTTAIRQAQTATITAILTNHVVPNVRAYAPTLTNGATLTTAGGGSLTVTTGAGNTVSLKSRGNGAVLSKVIMPSLNATNGVIHKIDRVLLP